MNWKNDIVFKRKAQTSNVFLIETFDPKRVEEIKEWIRSGEFEANFKNLNIEKKILLDPFEGLIDLKTGEKIQLEGVFGFGLPTSINYLDQSLKNVPTVVIINNIAKPDLANSLSLALQNWAYHPKLYDNQSTVFVITPDVLLFDEQTRRYCVVVTPPFSTEEERKKILDKISKTLNLKYDPILVRISSGLTLHDLETAVLESALRTKKIDLLGVTKAKIEMIRRFGYELTYPKYGFEAIGGYETLKEYFRNNIIRILKDNIAQEWGVTSARGILMFGLGGTGKTLFAKAMAKEMQLPFIKVSSADFFRGIVGESERAIKTLQKVAEENAPCIIFIDEIDQIGLRRDMIMSTDSGVSRRAMNLLMDWLGDEDRRSIIIGATNLVEQMDPAFIRSGRFDYRIPLLLPDYHARKEIIRVHTQVVRKIPLKDVDYDEIAKDTFLWSGAEIELLVLEAARIARIKNKRFVSMEDFKEAFRNVRVNIDKRKREFESFLKTAKNYSSSTNLLDEQLREFVKKEGITKTERLKLFKQYI